MPKNNNTNERLNNKINSELEKIKDIENKICLLKNKKLEFDDLEKTGKLIKKELANTNKEINSFRNDNIPTIVRETNKTLSEQLKITTEDIIGILSYKI